MALRELALLPDASQVWSTLWEQLLPAKRLQPLSGNQRLTGAVDDRLQRRGTCVLLRVQALAATGDAVLVDQGEAERAVARRADEAAQWSKSVGKGADSVLGMKSVSHVMGVPAEYADRIRANRKRSSKRRPQMAVR